MCNPSREQKECPLLLRPQDLIADHDPAGANVFVALRHGVDDRDEDHAQDHTEKQRVYVSDETAHVSSHAGDCAR